MPDTGDGTDYADRLAAEADVTKEAWARTLDDMTAMANGLEEEGWETTVIAAGDTAPEHPDAGPADRYGMVHVVPGNKAEDVRRAVDVGNFPTYDVFRATVAGRVFLVTQLLDPDARTAILIAGSYEAGKAGSLIETASETGEMYTHLQKLDKTPLATFRHDDWEKFFPEDGVRAVLDGTSEGGEE